MKNRLIFKIASTGLNFLMSIIIGILVPRAIGPLSYGEFSYIVSTYGFLFQLLMLSSGTAYIFFISQKKYDLGYINLFYFSFLFVVSGMVVFISTITINTDFGLKYLWNGLSNNHLLYLGLIFGIFTNLQQSLISFSDSTSQTIQSEKIKLFSRFFIVLAIIFLIYKNSLNVYIYFILLILNFIIFFIIFFKYISFTLKHMDKTDFINICNDFFQYLKPLIIFTLIAACYSYLGKYVLQATSGSLEQGYYNFAYQLALIPVTFISSIMVIYMSEMTKKFQQHDIQGVRKIFEDNIFKLYTIHAFIVFYMMINAKEIILITVGENYLGAIGALQGLTIFSLLHTFGMFSRNIFLSSGRTKEYSIINSVSMIVGIVYVLFILIDNRTLTASHLASIMAFFYFSRVFIQLYFNFTFLKINKLNFILELGVITIILFAIFKLVSLGAYSLFQNLFLSITILLILNYIFSDYMKLNKLIKRN